MYCSKSKIEEQQSLFLLFLTNRRRSLFLILIILIFILLILELIITISPDSLVALPLVHPLVQPEEKTYVVGVEAPARGAEEKALYSIDARRAPTMQRRRSTSPAMSSSAAGVH
ncbi:hypothetical protein TYRP_020665 [Tyrophagus putrescentiae]|nr:hypothetical protein TYRP_020665 [Tyrophagus putrescentiae]